jgi:hypothetical protein
MSCPWTVGPYTVTWNALPLGQQRPDEGIRHSEQTFAEGIKGSQWGQTDQDLIFMGQDVSVSMTLLEYATALAALVFSPWSVVGRLGVPGRLAKCGSFAKPLVLTPLAGSAATGTRTYPLTILSPGFGVDYAFRPGLREVPIRLKALPAVVSTNLVFYTDA